MKRLVIGFAVLAAFIFFAPSLQAQSRGGKRGGQGGQIGGNGNRGNGNRGNGNRVNGGRISLNDAKGLARMWEEEKLARDVYTKLAATSNLGIFQNILRAENQHMQALSRLGGADRGPTRLNDVPGVFVFPEYQKLYLELVKEGARSPQDALMVGAKIEEMDIADVRKQLKGTNDAQTQFVLGRLLQGSYNHLRAFASQLSMVGAKYEAEFLSQAEFDAIANSTENGVGRGRGGGNAGTMGRAAGGQGAGGQGAGHGYGRSGTFGPSQQANGPGRGRRGGR